ncbi:FRG domain-containing protein [Rhizobium sp. WL3]|uniref:FRG domain-containing protein n=1 Tax=Rhizobium sp. WL3 TaxID=2603277 RepID=UPI0011C1DD9D|nr:FRG domain-containing protein [Rhizobium sp. WL3]QEE47488.1 FRG domain-containing protein [Rhizobium sp. WL3]
MAKVDTIEFDDARAYLDYLRPSADRWWSNNNRIDYVFRGHSNEQYRLVPRAFRKAEKPSELQRLATRIMAAAPDLDEVSAYQYAITEVMMSFAAVAKSVGIDVGTAPNVPSPYQSFELLALFQHYGGETSLLDWTRSPLVAATFAAEGDDSTAICVWALNKSTFGLNGSLEHIRTDGASVELVLQDAPIERNPYLFAQSGTFTYVQSRNHSKTDKIDWEPLERLHDYSAACALTKIVLTRSEVPRLRELLFRESLSKAHLMPDLGNSVRVAIQRCLLPEYSFSLLGP